MGGISPADPPVASLLSHPPTLYSEHDSLLLFKLQRTGIVLQPAVSVHCSVWCSVHCSCTLCSFQFTAVVHCVVFSSPQCELLPPLSHLSPVPPAGQPPKFHSKLFVFPYISKFCRLKTVDFTTHRNIKYMMIAQCVDKPQLDFAAFILAGTKKHAYSKGSFANLISISEVICGSYSNCGMSS